MRLDELRAHRARRPERSPIGAGVRQAACWPGPRLPNELPLLALALPWVGHAQTRSRGTICGSIAHADPSAELPLVLLALGGEVHLRSAKRRRRVAARRLLHRHDVDRARRRRTDRGGRRFRAATGRGCAFREVGAAARRFRHRRLRRGRQQATASASPSAASPTRRSARDWPRLDGSALDDALNAFAYELDARDDVHATARYRRDLVRRSAAT